MSPEYPSGPGGPASRSERPGWMFQNRGIPEDPSGPGRIAIHSQAGRVGLRRYHILPMAPIKPRSVGVHLSKDETKNWNRLASLQFQASRYPCKRALYTLGLSESWKYLCERGQLTDLFEEEHESYRILTYEFLSTLEVQMNGREVASMEFRLGNTKTTLSVDQFNDIFQFHRSDVGITEEPEEYNRNTFWRAIILPRESQEYNPARAKINEVRNPVLRYMLKAFAYLPFGRYEAGSVQNNDLFILWCILRGQPVNMGHYIIRYLERQATKVKKHICCGGIITRLARALDVDLSDYVAEQGPTLISYEVMKQTRMINVNSGNKCYLLQDQSDHFPIPDPQNTAVAGWEYTVNWQMNTDVHRRIIRDNPPGPWGRPNDLPMRGIHVQNPILPAEPQQNIIVPNAERENQNEGELQAEGSSRGVRRKRTFDVEKALDSMSQRIDEMQISINEGFEAQRQADIQWRAEQNAHWANYQADRQHDLQWQQRMENFWFSHFPHPPPQ